MIMSQVTFCPSELKRPAKVWKILKRAFIGRNCMECGICCSGPGGGHRIPVTGNDPFHDALLHAVLNVHHAKAEPAENGGFDIVGGDCCALLEDGGGRKGCRVYRMRPLICAIFPFIVSQVSVQGSEDESGETDKIIAVTTRCPPVKEIAERGVGYLVTADVVGNELPVLTESFKKVILCINMRLPLFRGSMLMNGDKPIFPIL